MPTQCAPKEDMDKVKKSRGRRSSKEPQAHHDFRMAAGTVALPPGVRRRDETALNILGHCGGLSDNKAQERATFMADWPMLVAS